MTQILERYTRDQPIMSTINCYNRIRNFFLPYQPFTNSSANLQLVISCLRWQHHHRTDMRRRSRPTTATKICLEKIEGHCRKRTFPFPAPELRHTPGYGIIRFSESTDRSHYGPYPVGVEINLSKVNTNMYVQDIYKVPYGYLTVT